MSIISEAPESAHSSEFYLKNKEICENWESHIISEGGEVDGSYNSWAIYFHGNIDKHNVSFQIQKSSIDNGGILIPAKKSIRKQSILLFSNISMKGSFVVRKKSFLDKTGLSSYKEINKDYSTNSKGRSNELDKLIKCLKQYLDQKEIKEFFFNKSTKQLQITFKKVLEEPLIIEDLYKALKN